MMAAPWLLAYAGPTVGPELPPSVWNAAFSWLPQFDPVTAPTAAPVIGVVVYVVAAVVVLGMLAGLRSRGSIGGDSEPETREADLSAMLEEHRREHGEQDAGVGREAGPGATAAGEGRTLADLGERHRNLLAAPSVEKDPRAPRVADQYTKTLIVGEYPDFPKDGYLSELYKLTDVKFDVNIYFHRRNQQQMEAALRRKANDLESEVNTNQSAGRLLSQYAEWMDAAAEAVESGQAVFDMAMYVTVRGDTREELQDNERKIRKALRNKPAQVELEVVEGKQHVALQSAAPLGPDKMHNIDSSRWGTPAVAGAVGATLASPNNPTLIEPSGIEFGLHKETKTPIIADPFKRENGHAIGVFGDPGAGKSVASKSNFVEFVTQRDDVIGFIIEPLGNWEGIVEAANHNTPPEYQAEHIVIGGDKGINPLEVRPATSSDQTDQSRGNPLKQKESSVLSFMTNFFANRGLLNGFSEHRTEFEAALRQTWEEAGITDDPATHDADDPTLRDLLDVLEARIDNAEEYARHDSEADQIRESASWLYRQLEPFTEGGRYENLGRASEIDLHGSDIVYLDLGQEEGNVSEKASLTMQLLITLVYERAKQTDKKVVLAMDEFRYILEDSVDLGFMETLFRHHRHHQISPWIMTQTVDEFFETESAQAILDMCTIKQFHKLEGMDEEWAKEFRFNEKVMRAIQEAQPGSESRDFSDAVVTIDDEPHPVEVRVPDGEFEVIEYDPSDQPITDLPGVDERAADSRRGRDTARDPAVADGGDDEPAGRADKPPAGTDTTTPGGAHDSE